MPGPFMPMGTAPVPRCPSSENLLAPGRRGHRSVPAPPLHCNPPPPEPAAAVGELSLPPFFYEADTTDAVDVALLQELVALNLEVSARLNIKRLKPGEYEIEGVRASMYWQNGELQVCLRRPGQKRGRRGRRRSGSFSAEDGSEELPLAKYLRELANVDSRKLTIMDPKIDSAVAAMAFAGATAGGIGLSLQPPPTQASPWLNGGAPGQVARPPVGPYGQAIAVAAAAAGAAAAAAVAGPFGGAPAA